MLGFALLTPTYGLPRVVHGVIQERLRALLDSSNPRAAQAGLDSRFSLLPVKQGALFRTLPHRIYNVLICDMFYELFALGEVVLMKRASLLEYHGVQSIYS